MSFFSGFMLGQITASNNKNGGSAGEGMAFLMAFGLIIFGIVLAFLGVANVIRAIAEWTAYFLGDVDISDVRSEYVGWVHRYDRYFRYSNNISFVAIAVPISASILWLLLCLRALIGSRLIFTIFALVSLVLISSTLVICGVETACKANIVAFDRGEIWYYPSRNGSGFWGTLWGITWLTAALLGLRWISQKPRVFSVLKRVDTIFLNVKNISLVIAFTIMILSLIIACFGVFLAITEQGVGLLIIFGTSVSLFFAAYFAILALLQKRSWKLFVIFLPFGILLTAGTKFYDLYDECSDMKFRSGYELTYELHCKWHHNWTSAE